MSRYENCFAVIGATLILAVGGASPVQAQAIGAGAVELPACDASIAAFATPSDELDAAETSTPAVLDALEGEWRGSGALFGSDARFVMTWEPTLDGRFLELRFEIEGPVRMKARAFYRLGSGDELRGTWIDTRGEFLGLSATATDSILATEWSSPGETGRTVYRLVGPDTVEVCDFVRGTEGWRPFGAARYERSPGT